MPHFSKILLIFWRLDGLIARNILSWDSLTHISQADCLWQFSKCHSEGHTGLMLIYLISMEGQMRNCSQNLGPAYSGLEEFQCPFHCKS